MSLGNMDALLCERLPTHDAPRRCVVERRRAEELQLLTDEHAPNKFRVNGPLSNLPEFAQAFGCAEGTRMAPTDRCELW